MDIDEVITQLRELIVIAKGAERQSDGRVTGESVGQPITSQAEATARFSTLQLDAEHSIEALDNGDYCAETHGQSVSQSMALSSGVRYRVVYSTSIFEADAHLEATLTAIAQGEEARVSDLVPSRLLIRDRREALVISKGYPDVEHLGFHTEHPFLVAYLCSIFDSVWDRALPASEHQLDGMRLVSPDEIQLLKYLVLGRTDASIARSLGVSTRTVQRQIQAIQYRLGARGRLQLGMRVGEFLSGRGEGERSGAAAPEASETAAPV